MQNQKTKNILKDAKKEKSQALLNRGRGKKAVDDLEFSITLKVSRFGSEIFSLAKKDLKLNDLRYLIENLPETACKLDLETQLENEQDLSNLEAENERHGL